MAFTCADALTRVGIKISQFISTFNLNLWVELIPCSFAGFWMKTEDRKKISS